MLVPTELPARSRPRAASDAKLVALCSLLPWLACLLLARTYPAVAHAYVLLGRFS
jgi:hypothetical protein